MDASRMTVLITLPISPSLVLAVVEKNEAKVGVALAMGKSALV